MQYLDIYLYFLSFILGSVFASFLTCMAYRTCHDMSPWGRSQCDSCGHVLSALDLIPIVSYLIRGGKCKYCGAKVPINNLIGEIVLAVLFLISYLKIGLSYYLLLILFFICFLFFGTMTDFEDRIIPDGSIVLAIVVRLVWYLLFEEVNFKSFGLLLVDGLSLSLAVLVIVLIMEKILKKEAMGGGDIKLLFVMGLYLGVLQCFLAVMIACISGIVGGVYYIKKDVSIPFGPFLAFGSVVSLFYGWQFISWYLGLLI